MSLSPTKKRLWRSHLSAYLETAEDFRKRRAYTQQRLYTGLGLPASEVQEDDCSAYTAKSFFRANKLSGVTVSDPLGDSFGRAGNTDSCNTYMRNGGGKKIVVTAKVVFFPGDVAVFDNPHTNRPTDHMMVCKTKGTRRTAVWSSHGHQSSVFSHDAPESVSLDYASTVLALVAVYRPKEVL